MNASLASLAEAVAIFVEPFTHLSTSSGLLEVMGACKVPHAAIHGFNVTGDFSELITELVLLNFDTASVSSRNRDRRFEVRLIVDIVHHSARL